MECNHYYNIDWMRAIASIVVVALHYGVFASPAAPESLTFGIVVYGYFFRLAVPLFMVISCFLFTRQTRSFGYINSKIKHMLFLTLAWSCAFYIANGGLLAYLKKLVEICDAIKISPLLLVHYSFSGMETVYYFFISLALVQLLAYFLQLVRTRVVILALVLCLSLVLSLPFVFDGSMAVFDNPLNYLAFAPIGILLNRNLDSIRKHRTLIGLMVLLFGIVMMLFEMLVLYKNDIKQIDGSTKVSLTFLASGVFIITISERKSCAIIKFMSEQSLMLYLLHACFYTIVGTISYVFLEKLPNIPEYLRAGLKSIMAISLCYFAGKVITPRILSSKMQNT